MSMLEVRDLTVDYPNGSGWTRAVDHVGFELAAGRALGIVGESGSGKTTLGRSLLGLNGPTARTSGSAHMNGTPIVGERADVHQVRGKRIGMIFQDPLSALHPFFTVGHQISETLRRHNAGMSRKTANALVVDLLGQVGIPDPAARARWYPHELSGGMRQRAMIAMALSCEPDVLIADEPTTALDVAVQAQILELLKSLKKDRQLAMLLITHDLAVVSQLCEDVLVMYGGRIVERAPSEILFSRPSHPYTLGLLNATPRIGARKVRLDAIPGVPGIPPGGPDQCYFRTRCPLACVVGDRVATREPPLATVAPEHLVACHLEPAEVHGRWKEHIGG
jgi:peptide/nickel transport system ATP-binding protein